MYIPRPKPKLIRIDFPPLEEWQKPVFESVTNDTKGGIYVLKSRRQTGKTILAILILIKYALTKKSTSILVEPTLNQSRRVFKQLTGMLQGSGAIKSSNGSLLTIEFANGSEIIFKSAEQEESLRGMTVDGGILVIDEGAFIKDDIFDILFPCVDANNAPILIISTPLFQSGRFYELYNDSHNVHFDWSRYDTSKYLSREKLEHYRQILSPNKFKSEYLGEFLADGSFVFGDLTSAITDYSRNQSVFCGIDWATGNDGDYTVVIMLDSNGNVTFIDRFNNIQPTEQIERITRILNAHPSLKKIQVELNSIGRVFFDLLKKSYSKPNIIQGFNTTNDSKRRIIEQLVKAFQTGAITIPNDSDLKMELQHYAVEKTSKGYTYNGLGAHDDMVMALAIAYDTYQNNNGSYSISVGRNVCRTK